MPSISISSRDHVNNQSMVAPAAKTIGGLTLRPLSLGSLEVLRQMNNALAAGDIDPEAMDTHTLTEYIWVHAAPVDEVLEVVYNRPSQIAKEVAKFAMGVTPTELRLLTGTLAADQAAVQAASVTAIPDPSLPDSPNAPTLR